MGGRVKGGWRCFLHFLNLAIVAALRTRLRKSAGSNFTSVQPGCSQRPGIYYPCLGQIHPIRPQANSPGPSSTQIPTTEPWAAAMDSSSIPRVPLCWPMPSPASSQLRAELSRAPAPCAVTGGGHWLLSGLS